MPARVHAQCNCDYTIPVNVVYVDADTLNIQPGDVICIQAGERTHLGLKNFHGTASQPIIFKNCGGQVVISNDNFYYGIRLDNCKYFRFTGTGSPQHLYGFKVAKTGWSAIGMTIGIGSTDFEVDHVEISNTGFAGLMCKTDPDCTGKPNRGNFVQANTVIHHNYIHHTGGEGIYVGFPHYTGIVRDCNGDSIRVYPHDLDGVQIYNNIIESTGREGIQVGCAVNNVNIFNNTISDYGTTDVGWQRGGIHLSTGTTGKLYNNLIKDGKGMGIWLNGKGDNLVFNNLIIRPGEHGIYCMDSLVTEGSGYYIYNNTIVSPAQDGLNSNNQRNTFSHFYNNIIAAPGGTYMHFLDASKWDEFYNVGRPKVSHLFFEDPDTDNYHLRQYSPAVDAGTDLSSQGVTFDYDYTLRFGGKTFDSGALESPYERIETDFIIYPNPTDSVFTIQFLLIEDGEVTIEFFDVRGVNVATVLDAEYKETDLYKIKFNASFLASGQYICRLNRGYRTDTKTVLVLK